MGAEEQRRPSAGFVEALLGANMVRAARILVLLLLAPALALAAGCSDEGVTPPDGDGGEEPEPQPVTEDEAAEAVLDFLEAQGIFESAQTQGVEASTAADLPLPAPSDYVTTEERAGNLVVSFWLDAEGAVIPGAEWHEENAEYCGEQNRARTPARSRMSVEVHNTTFEVFIREVDVETAVVEQMTHGTGDGEHWLAEALQEAWGELDDGTVQPVGDPCGAEFGARLLMDSRIEIYYDDHFVQASHVEAEIGLAPVDDHDGPYEGVGTVSHVEYWDRVHSGMCRIETISAPYAVEAVFPDGPFRHHPDIELTLSAPQAESFPHIIVDCPDSEPEQEWVWAPHFLIHHTNDLEPAPVHLSGWEASDDEQVLARLGFERERLVYPTDGSDPDPVLSVEITDLEIRRLEEG